MNKLYPFFAIFVLIFGIYLYTAYPTIPPYRDSGDLIASSYTLGIAHPPGYPLYSLTGKIFSVIFPYANIAYRINLMSIFFGALTIVITAGCIYLISGSFALSGVLSIALGFCPAFWSLSHVSEMYTLTAFFAAVIFMMFVKEWNNNILYIASFVFGLGLGSHPSLVLLLPGIILFVFFRKKSFNLSAKLCVNLLLLFLLGFSVYSFLILRSSAGPVLDWGNPEKFKNFLRVITRADYGGLKLHPEQSKFQWSVYSVLAQTWLFIRAMAGQFGLIGFLAGISGMYYCYRKKYLSLLMPGFIFAGLLFFILANLPVKEKTTLPILEPNLVLPSLIFSLFIGFGFSSINAGRWRNLMYVFSIAMFLNISVKNLSDYNRRSHFFAYDYGKNVLFTMEKDSILFDPDDATAFILNYLRICENKRGDIKPVMYFRTRWGYEYIKKMYPEILPQEDIPSGQKLIKVIFDYNINRRKIYLDVVTKVPEGYKTYSDGLIYGINAITGGVKHNMRRIEGLFDNYAYRGTYDTRLYSDFFTQRILYYYAAAHNNTGLEYLNFDTEKAREHYRESLYIKYDMPEAWNNLGSLLFAQEDFKDAIKYFKEAIKYKREDQSLHYNIALSYKAAGDYSSAIEYLNRAVKLGFYPNALNELGLIAIHQKDYMKAISIFRDLLFKVPGYYLAYYNLGLACQLSGDYSTAVESYNEYLKYVSDPGEIAEVGRIIKKLKRGINE